MLKVAKSVESIAAQINFDSVDELITAKNCRVSKLSLELGIPIPDLRLALSHHYGTRVIFKRGRSGGVFWSETVS